MLVRKTLQACGTDLTARITGSAQERLVGGLMRSLDLAKAFDAVSYSEMHLALAETGMPEELRALLVHIHAPTKLVIRHGDSQGVVQMKRGLRQGCPIAPVIYAAWTARFSKQVSSKISREWPQEHISIYADDKSIASGRLPVDRICARPFDSCTLPSRL